MEQKSAERLAHPFPPVFDANSRVLILGSFPSVKSREQRFYYGHPQNRFWRVLAALYGENIPATEKEKRELINKHGLALWDVIAECEIAGSSDSSIRSVRANDLSVILNACPVRLIACNGSTSHALYMKHIYPATGREALRLPSTSPANAAWTLPRLLEAWRAVLI